MIPLIYLCVAALVPAIAAATNSDGNVVKIDFSKLPNGSPLKGAMYLHDEWLSKYGLLLSASGGLSDKPRLFDSLYPGTKELGDPDLGSPNERCGGPGKGEGGEPDAVGANCEPLGNVLIIQEVNSRPDIPDDNVDGGVITLHFDKPVRFAEIGLLDIDYKSFLRVTTSKSSKTSSFDVSIPMLGDNSAQTIKVDTDNVVRLDLNLRRSGAITFFSFYHSTDLSRTGEICTSDESCETHFCFNAELPDGAKPAGVCSCDPTANTGCEEGDVCAYSPLVDIGPPECFIPMGASCSSDAECVSDNCFDGQCQCNEDLNFPCADNEVCSFQEGAGYSCFLKIGEPCYGDCAPDLFCFNAELPGGVRPVGVCSCDPTAKTGCEEGEVCDYSPLVDIGPPECFLPMGALCSTDSECVSDHCYEERCMCNQDLENFPCADDEFCSFGAGRGQYECRTTLKDNNEECLKDFECETGYCAADWWIEEGQPGLCKCNSRTQIGCPEGLTCISPRIPGSLPSCFLTAGQQCENDDECFSGSCVDNMCTVCNEATNYPCPSDMKCVPDDTEELGYSCLVIVGDACYVNDDCETGNCWNEYPPGPPGLWDGICVCVPETNQGCAGVEECTTRPGTFNEPPSCYLPIGAKCEVDIQCLSGHCYNEICVCNLETNFPCAESEACVFKDSAYTCETCAVPDPTGCPSSTPVTCNGCKYANECLAFNAGYRRPTDCVYSNEFVPGPDPGHLYKAFEARDIGWHEAQVRVKLLSDKCGYIGRLATISSLEEDIFVHEQGRAIHGYKSPTGFWVGGFQNVESKEFHEPGGGWEWVGNDGPISTPSHPISGKYMNWGKREPNNLRTQRQNPDKLPENHMTVCRFDTYASNDAGKATGWNDEFPGSFIRGYIAELEADYPTVYVHSCDTGVENYRLPSPPGDGCPPGQISNLIYGCAGNNRDQAYFECVVHFAQELEKAKLITTDEKNKIVSCTR